MALVRSLAQDDRRGNRCKNYLSDKSADCRENLSRRQPYLPQFQAAIALAAGREEDAQKIGEVVESAGGETDEPRCLAED